jgi:hypothetical protein
MPHTQIASVIDCSIQTVYNLLQLFYETNDVIEREGRGRLPWNSDDIHVLRQLFYRYPTETSASINNRFFRRTNRRITCRTIRNYRRSLGFRPVHAREQPLLSQRYAQQRLFFCRQYVQNDYRNIIFSDEKMFEVDRSGVVHWIPYNRPRPTSFRSRHVPTPILASSVGVEYRVLSRRIDIEVLVLLALRVPSDRGIDRYWY